MRVLQLTGPLAGRIVDLPLTEATSCIAAGTASYSWEMPNVPGFVLLDPLDPKPTATAEPTPVDLNGVSVPDDPSFSNP